MGVIEILTIIGIVLRLVGVIDWSWQVILGPEMITLVLYIDWIMLQLFRWHHDRRKQKRKGV